MADNDDQFNWNITIDYAHANAEWEASVESSGDYGPSYVAHNVYELLAALARDLRSEVGIAHHTEFIPKGYARTHDSTRPDQPDVRKDLRSLLDYAQPSEETDAAENGTDGHIIEPIRRLREWLNAID